jgi:sugar/nucleoside kinase (ribokinase family)
LIETALNLAKIKGLIISLDLSSYNIVDENRDFLLDMTKKYVDILFANEEEAKAFTKEQEYDKALDFMSNYCDIAILKIGAEGSMIAFNGEKTIIRPEIVNSIDTTGAGDLYASGFLYGYINSLPVKKCGQIASLLATNVIQIIGTKLTEDQWINIKQNIEIIINNIQ